MLIDNEKDLVVNYDVIFDNNKKEIVRRKIETLPQHPKISEYIRFPYSGGNIGEKDETREAVNNACNKRYIRLYKVLKPF